MNANGDKHPLSGHSLWMQVNFNQLYTGSPVWHQPWGPDPQPYGPELIVNGSFDGQAPWVNGGSWSFNGGKANYLDTNTAVIYQYFNYFSDSSYLLKFDISNCLGTTGLRFIYPGQIHIFKPPYNIYFYLTNGHYEYIVSPVLDRSIFYISGSQTRDAFSIDNVSFRKIL